jgi:outer membrane protein TolC
MILLAMVVAWLQPARDTTRLTLDAAVQLALQRAPVLEAARQARAGASGARRQVASQWRPQVGLEGTLTQFEEQMLVGPIHAFTPSAIPPFDPTLVQGNVNAGWTLFDGGIRKGQVGEAAALEDAARFRVDGTAQRLIASVVRSYTAVLAAREGVTAQDQRRQSLEAEAARVNRLLAEGRAAPLERMRADAAVAAALADRAAALGRLEVAEASLARLVGTSPALTRGPSLVAVRGVESAPPDRAALIALARSSSPAIQAATSRVSAAESAVRAAGGAWYPSLRAEGRLVTYGSGSGHYSAEWQAGVRASWPVYTGGNRGASIDRARAGAAEAAAELRDLELSLANEIDQNIAVLTETERRIAALESAVTQLGEAQRVEALALGQGAGTQTDFLRSEADLAVGRAALANARAERIATRVELARLVGSLSPATLPTMVTTQQETSR